MNGTPKTDALIERHTKETEDALDRLDSMAGRLEPGHAVRQITELIAHARYLEGENERLRKLHDDQARCLSEGKPLLIAASHALRTYQHGNASPHLAESVADKIDAHLEASK